jgi:hypothetical protein
MVAATSRAIQAKKNFIAERLEHWQEKYDYEKINAEWQEDSYYRYALLRLLAAKQAAIDAAVEQFNADFAEEMNQERIDATAFRSSQREAFSTYVTTTRDNLVAMIGTVAQ